MENNKLKEWENVNKRMVSKGVNEKENDNGNEKQVRKR